MESSNINASCNNNSDNGGMNGGEDLSLSDTFNVRIPIVGFEVMDERARFTVFKLKIENEKLGDSWLVFRRYTDFVRLHNKLKDEYPDLHIPLPPKRWLRDNFDTSFLEDRMKGLQAFVDSILLLRPDLTRSPTVREFFCLDEPPIYPENAEESRAMFGTVEENIMHLKQQLTDKDLEIEILKTELAMLTNQRESLLKCTKSCRNCSQRLSFISTPSPENINSSSVTEKPVTQAVPSRNLRSSCSGSEQSSSSSSLTSNDKSLQNSPKITAIKESSPPKINGNLHSVINEGAKENFTQLLSSNPNLNL